MSTLASLLLARSFLASLPKQLPPSTHDSILALSSVASRFAWYWPTTVFVVPAAGQVDVRPAQLAPLLLKEFPKQWGDAFHITASPILRLPTFGLGAYSASITGSGSPYSRDLGLVTGEPCTALARNRRSCSILVICNLSDVKAGKASDTASLSCRTGITGRNEAISFLPRSNDQVDAVLPPAAAGIAGRAERRKSSALAAP